MKPALTGPISDPERRRAVIVTTGVCSRPSVSDDRSDRPANRFAGADCGVSAACGPLRSETAAGHIGRRDGGAAAVAIILYGLARDSAPRPYRLGDWPAPFGIVLVLDRLSATMLVLAALLALCVILYAINGWDARGRHFHPLFQFQLLGINGAFLTGDIFNLFVFFEVMLIASYGLLLHGGGPRRLQAGFQYVTIICSPRRCSCSR